MLDDFIDSLNLELPKIFCPNNQWQYIPTLNFKNKFVDIKIDLKEFPNISQGKKKAGYDNPLVEQKEYKKRQKIKNNKI